MTGEDSRTRHSSLDAQLQLGEVAVTESPTCLPADPDDRRVICPFCGSDETEPHAMFGSLMLMEQHYCRACRTVFERVRGEEPPAEPKD